MDKTRSIIELDLGTILGYYKKLFLTPKQENPN